MTSAAILGFAFLFGIAVHSFFPSKSFSLAWLATSLLISAFAAWKTRKQKSHLIFLILFSFTLGFTRFEMVRPSFPGELKIFDAKSFAYDRSDPNGWFAERRLRLTQRILAVMPGDQGQLLAGILYGERGLSKTTKDAVRRSGLSHLVAVSGANVTIILAAVMRLLKPLKWSKRQRFWAISIGLITFVLFVNPQPPVTRAAIMGWLIAFAPIVGRLPDFRHLLLVAAVAFTAWRPESLFFDPSFALSFLAMIGLQTYGAKTADWVEAKTKSPMFAELVGSTVGAMLLTSPYAMWAFGQLSLVGLVSNVFAVPLVPWAMAFGTIILFLPWSPLIFITKFFLDAILKVADLSAMSPVGIWDDVLVSPWFMIGCYLALAIFWKGVIHKKVSKSGQMSNLSDRNTSLFFS